MNLLRNFVFAALPAILVSGTGAFGQTTFGSISGAVIDPSGALVPESKIQVTSEEEGNAREVTTGSSGIFNVSNLG